MINSVSERSTFFTPLGVSPFQFGPATRKVPPSLILGPYAKRVQLDIMSTFERHEEADILTVVLYDLCFVKLKLFEKLVALSGFVPKPTRRLDVDTHRPRKEVCEKGQIIIGRSAHSQHRVIL
jgi:hypothetical protein